MDNQLMATAPAPVLALGGEAAPPPVIVDGASPVKVIDSNTLRSLGQELNKLFGQYASDRQLTEQKYLQNLRQYLGIYDPEIESQLSPAAQPRPTRA
jgi:hypothetical protein